MKKGSLAVLCSPFARDTFESCPQQYTQGLNARSYIIFVGRETLNHAPVLPASPRLTIMLLRQRELGMFIHASAASTQDP